jgi:DNA polymerase/3'-5' exonuclease PolX
MSLKPKITFKVKVKVKDKDKVKDAKEPECECEAHTSELYDLRKDAGLEFKLMEDLNSGILTMLNSLIDVTVALKAVAEPKDRTALSHRITSFMKGRDAIRGYQSEINSGTQARQNIPGVGEGIAKRIDEYLKTGTLQEIEKAISPEAKIIMELTTVTGIGDVKARQLMDTFKVTSVQDLIDKYTLGQIKVATNQLTHHIVVGLTYYNDLKLRMSWDEADKISTMVKRLVQGYNKDLLVTVCGSYRRKKQTCGDIDVLITHPFIKTDDETGTSTVLPKLVELMEREGLLVGHLTSHGNTKYMGVCRLGSGTSEGACELEPEPEPGRRIDIRFVPYNSMGAAILYFTGSGTFNKLMRFRANQRGYTLNEYGLFHYNNGVKGEQVATPTEQDVFSILRFLYLKPELRDF